MSAYLGQCKEREEEDAHGSTLFVSNLPYTATSVDLGTLFSDVAPVRTAFVVTERGTGVSKGVGYVSFALKEDAESCYKQVAEEGLAIAGRKIRIQWADKKVRKPENGTEEKNEVKSWPRAARAPHDPFAVRTVVVSGLPTPLDANTLWKKIRKCPGAEDCTWPVEKGSGEDDPAVAHVLFSDPGKAQDAVSKLHAHVYKGSLLSVTLKKPLELLAKPVTKKGFQTTTTTTANRAGRLIIRNLPFDVTEQDLRALFLPYGPVHSITLPMIEVKEDENEDEEEDAKEKKNTHPAQFQTRNKGFAFVWMLSKKDAEKALEACNGKVIRAGLAEVLVSGKQNRKKQIRLEKKLKGVSKGAAATEASGAGESDREKEEVEEDSKDKKAADRIIAVDWALSKGKWKAEVAKLEEKATDEDVDMERVSDVHSDSESEIDSESDEGLVHDDDEDEAGSSPDEDEDCERDTYDEPAKPQLPPPETGTTLFVRNVPYIATEEELRILFRAFGPLRYARITMDPGTGRSRGTGFACFWNKEDADKVVEQSDILRSENTGLKIAPKKNPFSLPSILTADPSSRLARSLVLHGRTLDVVRAVTRETASKLREEGEKLREKQDKRNMYLLREGIIHLNSPAAANLSPAEIERRTASYNSRRTLLKSNLSLFISKTRLSIRQIPLFVTERMLKRLAIHALRAFKVEVREGTRQDLTLDEAAERSESALDDILEKGLVEAGYKTGKQQAAAAAAATAIVCSKNLKSKGKGKGEGRDTGVKQTKIVRQVDRVDPIAGKGRSKGYGFIEMTKHADSLRVLRWANNNNDVSPLFEKWYKEELVDILKREKAKEEGEGAKDEARIKRIKEEIESGNAARQKERRTLIVEFSIENVQVVQRRAVILQKYLSKEKETTTGEESAEESAAEGEAEVKEKKRAKNSSSSRTKKSKRSVAEVAGAPSKRRKVEKSDDGENTGVLAKKAGDYPKKAFNPVGAVIGRKRKETKIRKKGKA